MQYFAWEVLLGSLVVGCGLGMVLSQWLTRGDAETPTPRLVTGMLIALATGMAGGLSLALVGYV